MSEHTERFSGRVEAYRRYRAGYPAAAITGFLERACGLKREWRVADVAAGTGMLTEVFLECGNPVIAIEPNAEMLAVCREMKDRWPALQVKQGTAEATGLDAGSMDLISAGRAFHWFDSERAAREFRRALVPGGWVVLVASGRDRDITARGLELEEILREHGTDYAHVRDHFRRQGSMDNFFRMLAGLAPAAETEDGSEEKREVASGGVQLHAKFAQERRLDWEQFAGMVQSMSSAPLAGDLRSAGMQEALREYFGRWSEDGELRMMEVCHVQAGRVAAASETSFPA